MYEEMKKEDPERYNSLKNGGWANLNEFMDSPSENRNYDWFSVLANVRNGYGFAGIKTGEGFKVIAQPKGFPSNASREAMELLGLVIDDSMTMEDFAENGGEIKVGENDYIYKYPRLKIIDWGCQYLDKDETIAENVDYHSYSHFTAKELEAFDWSAKMTMKRGSVSLSQYETLRETGGCPNNYSGEVWGQNIVTINEQEADKVLKQGVDNSPYKGKDVIVNYHWMVNYKELFEHKFKDTIKPLAKLAKKYEDARIVFAFDN